jgi:hypothetical protein
MQTIANHYDEMILQGHFGRHETFTPRYGWLKKGYDAIVKDGHIFSAQDAIEKLGVGKNMVNSIKYWCNAFKLIKPHTDDKSLMVPTEFGDRLLSSNGWDSYLEDPASLWLLHWQLFTPMLSALTWNFAFNKCNLWSFSIKQLNVIMINFAQQYPKFASVSENTFEKDASCIIRMYADAHNENDNEIDCPFTQLGLIYRSGDGSDVSFNSSYKQSLPPLIYAAACFSYLQHYSSGKQQSISLHRLTYDFNSPGIAFKIPESVAGAYLANAAQKLSGFSLRDDLGGHQIYLELAPETLYWEAIEKHYEESSV